MPTDYYELLGVSRDASEADIKRAYRQMARKHHPDVAEDKEAAENHFKEINEAYSVLSDSQKRAQYDRFGHAGVNGGNGAGAGFGGFGGEGFGDIFDMFFGGARAGGNAARANGPQRGSDLRYNIAITLEQAFSGVEQEVSFRHLTACGPCKGSGAEPGTLVVACDRCNGTGIARQLRQTPLGQFVTQTTCSKCNGEGHVIQHPCTTCHGRGRIEGEKRLTVTIPAGIDDGNQIRVPGAGEAGLRGGPDGDLYVAVSVRPHERFRRNGLDLALDVPISFAKAALGGEIQVPSLEGDLTLTIPPGTQSGSTQRMRGHGMPAIRSKARGDLRVSLHVVVPTKLSKRQREILEEYASAEEQPHADRSFFERIREAFRPE